MVLVFDMSTGEQEYAEGQRPAVSARRRPGWYCPAAAESEPLPPTEDELGLRLLSVAEAEWKAK